MAVNNTPPPNIGSSNVQGNEPTTPQEKTSQATGTSEGRNVSDLTKSPTTLATKVSNAWSSIKEFASSVSGSISKSFTATSSPRLSDDEMKKAAGGALGIDLGGGSEDPVEVEEEPKLPPRTMGPGGSEASEPKDLDTVDPSMINRPKSPRGQQNAPVSGAFC